MSAGSNEGKLKVCNDLSMLAPAFAFNVAAAIEECNASGLEAIVYETYRTPELQTLYFKRGRSIIPPFKPVTNAKTNLQSWHGFGLAVDIVHKTHYWEPPEGDRWFEDVSKIFQVHMCNWGGNWTKPDFPHFQWARCTPSPSDAVRALLSDEGMIAVWNKLEANNWPKKQQT